MTETFSSESLLRTNDVIEETGAKDMTLRVTACIEEAPWESVS